MTRNDGAAQVKELTLKYQGDGEVAMFLRQLQSTVEQCVQQQLAAARRGVHLHLHACVVMLCVHAYVLVCVCVLCGTTP